MASRRHTPSSQCFEPRIKHDKTKNAMYAVLSTDVMGNRNVEVVPVGAWVEPADDDEIQPDAVRAAEIEEERIQQLQAEKENRLRKFHRQTKQRVSHASRLKRQQQIQEAEQAFELERKVVQQSCLTADMARRDTCLHREEMDLAIKNRLLQRFGEDISKWERENLENFESQSKESHLESGKARQQLVSKKIVQNGNQKAFGSGNVLITRDIQNPTVRSGVGLKDFPTSKQTTNKYENKNENCENKETEQDEDDDDDDDDAEENNQAEDEVEDNDIDNSPRQNVQFTEEPTVQTYGKEARKKKRPGSSKRPQSGRLSAVLSKDAENDALARQRRQQAAISRRVFMDREREAVRENIRRKEHQKKIVKLKNEKEQYRQELEAMAFRQVEPIDPITGETAKEKRMREKMEALEVKEMVDRRAEEIRRAREMERYLDALKHSLIEKVTRQGIQLPALCACGESVWDTHPETCANNCFFYRNHRAYARALQSLLSSADVL